MTRRGPWRRAKYHMRPDRVLVRYMTGGRRNSAKAAVRAPFREKTVATPAAMRRQHGQWTKEAAKERAEARRAESATRREQARAEQAAARAERRARPAGARPPEAGRDVPRNPGTGKPITWRQAQAGVRAAEREARRIEDALAGRKGAPRRRPAAKAVAPPKTPLQRAIEDVQKARARGTAKKAPAKKAAAREPSGRKPAPVPPVPAGAQPPPARPGRNLRGVVMAAACECHGTGRIPVYRDRALAGTVSCPAHGRKGRGARKFTGRRSLLYAGLPGIAGWLERKSAPGSRTPDRKQGRALRQAATRPRNTGPTAVCGRCDRGVVNRALTERLRERYVSDELAKIADEARRERAGRRLGREAQSRYPHDLCRACGGLGVVPKAAGAGWFADAGLRKGHRATARERATGRRGTENARRLGRGGPSR